jgi:hypothetical protein
MIKTLYKDKHRDMMLEKMVRNFQNYMDYKDTHQGYDALLSNSNGSKDRGLKLRNMMEKLFNRQKDKRRHAFKNNVFNYLDDFNLNDNMMKDLDDLATSGSNRGMKEIIDIAKKVRNGDLQEHVALASSNLLFKIKNLELKRYS